MGGSKGSIGPRGVWNPLAVYLVSVCGTTTWPTRTVTGFTGGPRKPWNIFLFATRGVFRRRGWGRSAVDWCALVCKRWLTFLQTLQWRRVFLFICFMFPWLNFSTSKPSCMMLCHRYQYVSWYGEANVHKADAMSRGVGDLVPCKAWQKIFKAWLYWRFVSRHACFLNEFERCFLWLRLVIIARALSFQT